MSGKTLRRFKPGQKLGDQYTVLGTIDAKAGRHPIYIVWDHGAWSPMACKMFHTQADAGREAELLSELAHPGLVRCFGLGEHANVLIEFLEGPTLTRMLDDQPEGRLGVSNALRLAIHIGAALCHFHRKGVAYLDLSASNVIVVPGGRPVLIDLGGARRLSEERPSKVIGTDPYISPEECLQQAVTPAADVFGLGVLLFELLTGELPFPDGTRRVPFPQTERDAIDVRSLRPGLPRSLGELVMSCLAREPEQRPSMPVLLPGLHDFIRTGPRMWPPGFKPEGELRGAAATLSRTPSAG